jgi:hypothetical protein
MQSGKFLDSPPINIDLAYFRLKKLLINTSLKAQNGSYKQPVQHQDQLY